MSTLIRQYGLVMMAVLIGIFLICGVYQTFQNEWEKRGVIADGKQMEFEGRASTGGGYPILKTQDCQVKVGDVLDVRDLAHAADVDGKDLSKEITYKEISGNLLGKDGKSYLIDTTKEGVSWLQFQVKGKSGLVTCKEAIVIVDWRKSKQL